MVGWVVVEGLVTSIWSRDNIDSQIQEKDLARGREVARLDGIVIRLYGSRYSLRREKGIKSCWLPA